MSVPNVFALQGAQTTLKPFGVQNEHVLEVVGGDSLFFRTERNVYSVGKNESGQLALGCRYPVDRPTKITFPSITQGREVTIESLSYNSNHSAFVVTGGKHVFYAGSNDMGQVGIPRGGASSFDTPQLYDTKLYDDETVSQVACGVYHTLILTRENSLFLSGYNYFGMQTSPLEFVRINLIGSRIYNLPVSQISCGNCHLAILTEHGKVYTAGSNGFHQLGRNITETGYMALQKVDAMPNGVLFTRIMCGYYFTLFVDTEKRLWMSGGEHHPGKGLRLIQTDFGVKDACESGKALLIVSEANEIYLTSGGEDMSMRKLSIHDGRSNTGSIIRCIQSGSETIVHVVGKHTITRHFFGMKQQLNSVHTFCDVEIL